MKVLLQAKYEDLVGIEFTCHACGAKCKTEKMADIYSPILKYNIGYVWTAGWATCPVCLSKNQIENKCVKEQQKPLLH